MGFTLLTKFRLISFQSFDSGSKRLILFLLKSQLSLQAFRLGFLLFDYPIQPLDRGQGDALRIDRADVFVVLADAEGRREVLGLDRRFGHPKGKCGKGK